MIAVLDYGIGNLRSAEKALQFVGADARLVSDPEQARKADAVVLPGVGAFGACAEALRKSGLDEVAREAIAEQRPTLAVCIGMQLLFDESEESPGCPGLGILPGVIRRIPAGVRRPQMQWNLVAPVTTDGRSSELLGEGEWFYFVHGYAAELGEPGDLAGTCEYGATLTAAVERGSLFATQFHPEKSGRAGLALLARFAKACGG
ncbi:MAG: imidazole glycerol phosphate synthase subunit HisH [Acidimicrobiales bacterium]